MNKPTRLNTNTLTVAPVDTFKVDLARDNFVCAICKQPWNGDPGVVVSHQSRKGVIIFACREHAQEAMDLLSKLL